MAAQRVERELKLLLDIDDLGALRDALVAQEGMCVQKSYRQRSHFFDTARGAFTKQGISLRLREVVEDTRPARVAWEVTVKGGGSREGSTVTKPEEEAEVSAEVAQSLLARGGAGLLDCLDQSSPLVRRCREVFAAIPEGEGRRMELKDAFDNHRWVVGPLRVAGLPAEQQVHPPVFLELDRTTFCHRGSTRVEAELECEVPSPSLVPHVEAHIRSLIAKFCKRPTSPALGKRTRFGLFKVKVDSALARGAKL